MANLLSDNILSRYFILFPQKPVSAYQYVSLKFSYSLNFLFGVSLIKSRRI